MGQLASGVFLLCSLLLLSPASDAAQLGWEDARHLLARTGFGASPTEIAQLQTLNRFAAIDQILANGRSEPVVAMPRWTEFDNYPYAHIELLGPSIADLFFDMRFQEKEDLAAWWLGEMIATPSPLTERMTLFWHNHFVTEFDRTENPHWTAKQNQLFRSHALGNFRDLAAAMVRDPSLLVYLDNPENVVGAPNENLAREWFELFTLGEGRGYSEEDIKQAARALTGQSIDFEGTNGFLFRSEDHDGERKTIFGWSGRFAGDDLVDLALKNPEFGPFIVEKLWREFISDQPAAAEVNRLAELWRAEQFEMKPLMRALFLSDAFWAEENRGRLVKSPVDLMVGTIRTLALPIDDLGDLAEASAEMGQTLFNPPNVAGWPGGVAWITDATALARTEMLTYLLDWRDYGQVDGRRVSENPLSPMSREEDTLRIGLPLIYGAFREGHEDGEAAFVEMLLLDVSIDGQRWSHLPLRLEWGKEDGESWVGLGVERAFCRPDCLESWGEAEEDALFHPEEWLLEELDGVEAADLRLFASLAHAAPDLLASTRRHPAWTDPEAEEDAELMPYEAAQRLADEIARRTKALALIDPPRLALGPSHEGAFGLPAGVRPGMSEARMADMADAMMEERSGLDRITAEVRAAHGGEPNAARWAEQLPPTSLAFEKTLLAVPTSKQGRRMALQVDDPEALIRRLVTDPRYHVY
jgi:uncharacterized protein (DUF1800 family)